MSKDKIGEHGDECATCAYWRDAVKNVNPWTVKNTSSYCIFCGVSSKYDHKPDCLWLVAWDGA